MHARGATIAACGGGGDDGAASALDAPRFVEEPGAIDHRYAGDFQYFVGGGVAAFDCDDDGRSDLFFAGGSEPAALYHNDSEPGGDAAVHATAVAGHRSDGGHRRLPAGHRRRRAQRARRLAGRRGRRAARARRLSVRAGQRVARHRRRRHLDGRLQRHLGRRRRLADPGVRRLPRRRPRALRGQPPPAPGSRRRGYAAPIALSPGYCTLSMLFSDWSRHRPARPADVERPALLPRRVASSCGASSPGATPRPYTEADGWRPLQIWGMGIASEDITGDGYPEVYLTSQGDNKLQTLADGPAATDLRGHRPRTRRHRHPALHRR